MSEQGRKYLTDENGEQIDVTTWNDLARNTTIDTTPAYESDCGHVHLSPTPCGREYRVYIDGLPFYAVHGDCPVCGMRFHWTSNDWRLKRLVERNG